MTPDDEFAAKCRREITEQGEDAGFTELSRAWLTKGSRTNYTYHFTALGRPIIQCPQDMVAVQELIWKVKPDLVIETGIAHGGSLILSGSMLALLDWCDAAEAGRPVDPRNSRRRVVGIDIEIRPHNRAAIDAHPLSLMISMIEGSSTDPTTVSRVAEVARDYKRTLVVLDSNHTHDHVLAELEAYAPLVSPGSYCIVFDTAIEDLLEVEWSGRDWGHGNNPKTAVREYLRLLEAEGRLASDGEPLHLTVDRQMESKLGITVAPEGYLQRSSCGG